MELIQFPTPATFHAPRDRVQRIGLHGQYLFVAHLGDRTAEHYFEVWRVHCMTPASWTRLCAFHFDELNYVRFALSQRYVYALVLADYVMVNVIK